MQITLKNGEVLKLEVSSLILEYIEDYEGGIDKLLEDAEGKIDEKGYTRIMYATNHLLYSIIASNYDKELTYRQAVRLVKIEDIENIIKYVTENIDRIKKDEKPKQTFSKHRM